MMLHHAHEAPLFSELDAIELHGECFGTFRRRVFGSRRCMIRGGNPRRHRRRVRLPEMPGSMFLAAPAVISAVTAHPAVITPTHATSAATSTFSLEVIFAV